MRRRTLITILAGGVAALLITLGATAEIVEHDATLHYTDDAFWRVRLPFGLELHVSQMTAPHVEAVISMILFLLGGAACLSFLFLQRIGVPDQGRLLAFFAVVAVGAIFLAIDELMEVNETIAANLDVLDHPPLPGRGNLDVITYPPAVAAFVAAFWPILRSSPPHVFALWATSIGLFAVTSALDVVGEYSTLEIAGELIVATGVTAGFVLLAVDRLVALTPRAARVA